MSRRNLSSTTPQKLRCMERQKQRVQGMRHVTNTAGALHLAFLGTKHFVLKLGPEVYAMYYTNIKINFRLRHQKTWSISSSFVVRHCKGVLHSSCSAEFDFPGIPHGPGTFQSCRARSGRVLQLLQGQYGHVGVLQLALRRAAQPASPAHLYNWHAVLNCLLLLRKEKKTICATLH